MKYIRKSLLTTDRFMIEFYQVKDRIEFGVSIDWSESPFLISIDLSFWTIEISIYSTKHIKINKEYDKHNKSY